jgi:hypothetical protein
MQNALNLEYFINTDEFTDVETFNENYYKSLQEKLNTNASNEFILTKEIQNSQNIQSKIIFMYF